MAFGNQTLGFHKVVLVWIRVLFIIKWLTVILMVFLRRSLVHQLLIVVVISVFIRFQILGVHPRMMKGLFS